MCQKAEEIAAARRVLDDAAIGIEEWLASLVTRARNGYVVYYYPQALAKIREIKER